MESTEPANRVLGTERRRRETPRRLRVRRAAAFAIALTITLLLAFNGGGYDVVVRDEVGIALWAAIALGLGTGMLPRARLSPAAVVALGGFGALAALTFLSHAWTTSDEATTAELARVLQYLGVVVLAYLALNRYTWRGAAMGFATAALAVPFFALVARLSPDLITDELARIGTDRLAYPFGYWNAVACWGAMAVAIGITISANSRRLEFRAVSLACVPVAATTVYLSYSRFGAVAVAIGVVAAVALSRNRWTCVANALVAGACSAVAILIVRANDEIARATGDAGAASVVLALVAAAVVCGLVAVATDRARLDRVRMSPRSARLALGAGAVGALLVAVALNGPIGDGWEEFKNDRPPPATGGTERFTSLGSSRYDVWTAAVDAFEADPVVGRGPGTFEYYWSQNGEGPEFARDAHSLYLEEAAELGIFGLIALLAGLGGLLAVAIQARTRSRSRDIAARAPMIASFIVFLAYAGIDWMWEMGAIGMLAIGGVAAAGASGFDRASPAPMRTWVRAAAVVAALIAAAAQVPGLVATERIRASDSELAEGDFDRANELADQAVDAQPWAGSPYAAKAVALEAAGDLDGARTAAEDAIDRDPDNWRNHLILTRIDAARGDSGAVAADLEQVRELAPRSLWLNPDSPFRRELRELLAANAG